MTVRVTQGVRRVLATADPSPVRVTQAVRRVLSRAGGDIRVTQAVRRVLLQLQPDTLDFRRAFVAGGECVTGVSQLWLIRRRDGTEYCYTGHNEPVLFMGRIFSPCDSLMNSASSASAKLGNAGDISLSGIISDDGISEQELYGGLFDDAYVEVWLVDWGGAGALPRRIVAGWTGELSHGPSGLEMQVLGPSHRLDQNSVTTTITAACRWNFGDARCGFDREALAVTGTVVSLTDRGRFIGSIDSGSPSQYFVNGLLRWESGANQGEACEVKTVTADSGDWLIDLWRLAPLGIQAGDTFSMLPGCDKSRDSANGCQGYNNIINFGGFPDVPGQDALLDTPDAKF